MVRRSRASSTAAGPGPRGAISPNGSARGRRCGNGIAAALPMAPGIGRSGGGLTAKVRHAVDGNGRPLAVAVAVA